MELDIRISLPQLWRDEEFVKTEWGAINYLVGPNGTGKTLFAEALRPQCEAQGLRTRYLSAERLAGSEKYQATAFAYSYIERGLDIGKFGDYIAQARLYGLSTDAWIVLRDKRDVRLRVEATLSSLFGRRAWLRKEDSLFPRWFAGAPSTDLGRVSAMG